MNFFLQILQAPGGPFLSEHANSFAGYSAVAKLTHTQRFDFSSITRPSSFSSFSSIQVTKESKELQDLDSFIPSICELNLLNVVFDSSHLHQKL